MNTKAGLEVCYSYCKSTEKEKAPAVDQARQLEIFFKLSFIILKAS